MKTNQSTTRRETIRGLAMSLAGGLSIASLQPANAAAESIKELNGRRKTLVVYLSRSGNTRVIAGQLKRAFAADLFEIRTAAAWPEDYEEMVAWASRLKASGSRPALAQSVPGIEKYETVFLGSPIWDSSLPAPVRTFLATHDLSGKALVPFFTYGCCGAGSAPETIAELAPRANILKPFAMKCDQERDTLNSVSEWLRSAKLPT